MRNKGKICYISVILAKIFPEYSRYLPLVRKLSTQIIADKLKTDTNIFSTIKYRSNKSKNKNNNKFD